MYLKYIVNRARNAPSKMWNDWKKFRVSPGMEYYDIHDVLPGAFKQERFPSPASYKINPTFDKYKYKWDYKAPFRETPYSIRRKRPVVEDEIYMFTNCEISEKEIDEQLALTPAYKPFVKDPRLQKAKYETDIQKIREEARIAIESNFALIPYLDRLPGEISSQCEDLVQKYYPTVENYGENRQVDLVDGAPVFMQFYFDGLTMLQKYETRMQEENDNNLDIYVGRTKIWQTIPDFYGKDQVDKIQIAIKAPVQEQLDEWDRENNNKKLPLPVCNESLHKFRGDYEYYEILDHNYEKIIYERTRKQEFEQMRNSRYWEKAQLAIQDHSHSH